MPPSPRFRRPSWTALLLALLLVWAVGLRIWFGSHDLQIHRFWDEKFSVPNVHAALELGSLKPVRYAYLRFTYLPQVAVLGTLQTAARVVDPEFSWFQGEILSPRGFLISRSIQALIGGLSILLTFLVGRHLFSPGVGLLAAFLVAASPTHLIFSAIFKPDILAVATTLIAFLFSLYAIEKPTLWRYLLAGLGIGLALSSKPTAGTIAIPLAVAALILGFKDRRHWLGLMSAGVTSVLLFVALNPYPRYLNAFALQRQRYNAMAAQKGTLGDPLATLYHELITVFQFAHGAWVGVVALVGVFFLGFLVWKHRRQGKRAVQLSMVPIYLVSSLLLYAVVTQNVLPQNLLPLLPFTSLAAAVLFSAVWKQVAQRWVWLGDRRVAAVLGAVLVILVSLPGCARAYRVVVPTTKEVAIHILAARLSDEAQRSIVLEADGTSPSAYAGEPGPGVRPPSHLRFWNPPRLIDFDHDVLNRADAEVFPSERIEGPAQDFYMDRMGHDNNAGAARIESRPFKTWGPDLIAVFHPWQPREPVEVDLSKNADREWFQHHLSAPPLVQQVASVELWVERDRTATKTLRVEAGDHRLEMKRLRRKGKKDLWTSARFSLDPEVETPIRIRLPNPAQTDTVSVIVRRWERAL